MKDALTQAQLNAIEFAADSCSNRLHADGIAALLREVRRLTEDAQRFSYLAENYVAADFDYQRGDVRITALIVEVPDATHVCGDLRRDVDAAIEASHYLIASRPESPSVVPVESSSFGEPK